MVPWTAVIVATVSAVVASRFIDMNIVLMRFFRDLSRSKARKRLYGDNQHALMPMLLGREESILEDIYAKQREEEERLGGNKFTMTAAELSAYNGALSDDGVTTAPLYICIKGRIYDVTAGERFYGPDGKYHLFVGKDATRAYATGCLWDHCVSSSTEGLTEKEWKEIDRWLELYETHDKYTFVGYLVDDPVDKILELDELEELDEQ